MRIFICIKPVPDTAAKIKISTDGKSIDPSGVKFVLGPYDCRAVAKAVALRDAGGEGSELIVVSSGNPKKGESDVRKRIKDVLALGADRGILIPDEGYENRDPLAIAKALAAAIKNEGEFDLVVTGRQAVDDQAMSVGPMLATLLEVPCATDVVSLEIDGKTAKVQRAAEGRVDNLDMSLPAVITSQRDLAEEKYPKLKEILKANKKKVAEFPFEWPAAAYSVDVLSPPPDPVAGKIVGEGPDAVPELFNLLLNEAKSLTL